MSRSVFGWSYPPGAAGDPNAPWNQVEGPCDVCRQHIDSCVCPECPVCSAFGDPACYELHGLTLTPEQAASAAAMEQLRAKETERMNTPPEDYGDER